MSSSIVKQIAGLQRQSVPELKERWRDLFGTEAPAYNRAFLVKRLAYRLQELTHGGLSAATQAKMKDILRGAGLTEDGLTPGTGRSAKRTPNRPILGTRLVRTWRGDRHEVTVVQGGYEYQGRRYRSLTAITELITGTHWNGPAFFGLRTKRAEASR
jgi:hypothetical protein